MIIIIIIRGGEIQGFIIVSFIFSLRRKFTFPSKKLDQDVIDNDNRSEVYL